MPVKRGKPGRLVGIDFYVCGFRVRCLSVVVCTTTAARAAKAQAKGGGSTRHKTFQAGVYPPPAQPTNFSW